MISNWFQAIAASTLLTMTTASLVTAHPDWLVPEPPTSPKNNICGSQAIPYLAQPFNQNQTLGVRCLKKKASQSTSRTDQLLWYGADQGQGNYSCQLGTAYADTTSLPSVLAGEAMNFPDDPTEFSIPGVEPLSVQAIQGSWPAPLKIQIQGSRNEVWIRISNTQSIQPLMSRLRNCDRYWNDHYFKQSAPDSNGKRDRQYDDWLTRVGSGWYWLLHNPNSP